MALITGFSDSVREALKQLDVRVIREVTESGNILVQSLTCSKCGFSKEFNPAKQTKATAIRDCIWSHRFSWEAGKQCGGQVLFVTSPVA